LFDELRRRSGEELQDIRWLALAISRIPCGRSPAQRQERGHEPNFYVIHPVVRYLCELGDRRSLITDQ
jgi:hypothetical protein